MFSTICFLYMLGFLLWMNTSQRVRDDNRPRIVGYFFKRTALSRALIVFLFLAGLLMSICLFGSGSGVFVAIAVLMAAGCLTVLFGPFKWVGIGHVCTAYIICAFFELFIL